MMYFVTFPEIGNSCGGISLGGLPVTVRERMAKSSVVAGGAATADGRSNIQAK